MAASAARLAEPPGPPPRTPERERLAEAVERHKAATDRLQKLRLALERARSDSVDKFMAVEAAEAALAEAQKAEPRRRTALLIGEGDPDPSGQSVEVAQKTLDAATAEHRLAKEVIAGLEAEIRPGPSSAVGVAESAQGAVREAIVAVIATDPGFDRLVEAYDAARARVAALAEILRFLPLPRGLETWYSQNRPMPPVEPLVPAWKDAIERFAAGDVDTPLPGTL